MSTAPTPELTPDPAVDVQRWENGFSCWARPHHKADAPPEISLALHVRAGSLFEDDTERGGSHLLEHLAFEGGERLSTQNLADFRDRFGLSLGRHLNAFTAREWTSYIFNGPPEALDQALAWLADVARGLTLQKANLEQERAVVLAELRRQADVTHRARERVLQALLPESRLVTRPPGGSAEIVESLTRDTLAAFYQRWYRPERAALVAAGALPADFMKRVESLFSAWTASGPTPNEPSHGITTSESPRAVVVTEKDLPGAELRLLSPRFQRPWQTRDEWRAMTGEQTALWLVNQRLAATVLTGRSPAGVVPYHVARLGILPLATQWIVLQATIQPRGEEILGALAAVAQELRRATTHVFSNEEWATGQAHVFARAQKLTTLLEDSSASSLRQTLSETWMSYALGEARPPISQQQRLALTEEILPEITPDEVHKALLCALAGAPLISAVLPATFAAPRPEELLDTYEQAMASTPTAWVPPLPAGALVRQRPKPGAVHSRSEPPALGLTSVTLDNGTRVHLRPMSFRAERFYAEICLPGGRISENESTFGLTGAAALAFGQVIPEGRAPQRLKSYLSDKHLQLSHKVEEDAVLFRLDGHVRHLEDGLQLLHRILVASRVESALLKLWQDQVGERQRLPPEAMLAFNTTRLLTADDPRFRWLTGERAAAITLDEAQTWLENEICAAPLEAAFAGDFNEKELLPLVQRYLGSLPERSQRSLEELRQLKPWKGPLLLRHNSSDGQRALPLVGWRVTPWHEAGPRRVLQLATRLLNQRLHREIREVRGLTYQIACSYAPSRAYPEGSLLSIACETTPDRVDDTVLAIQQVTEELAANGPNDTELEACVRQLGTLADRVEQDPKYWARVLADSDYRGVDVSDLHGLAERYAAINASEVASTLGVCIAAERELVVVMEA